MKKIKKYRGLIEFLLMILTTAFLFYFTEFRLWYIFAALYIGTILLALLVKLGIYIWYKIIMYKNRGWYLKK